MHERANINVEQIFNIIKIYMVIYCAVASVLTLKDRAPIRTLIDRGGGAYLAPPPLSRKLL